MIFPTASEAREVTRTEVNLGLGTDEAGRINTWRTAKAPQSKRKEEKMVSPFSHRGLLLAVQGELDRAESGENPYASYGGAIPLITYRQVDSGELMKILQPFDFEYVDVSEFGGEMLDWEIFLQKIGFEKYNRFAFILPRLIPTTVAVFLYNLIERGVLPPSGFNKAWMVMMERDDYENMEIENGMNPGSLKVGFTPHIFVQ